MTLAKCLLPNKLAFMGIGVGASTPFWGAQSKLRPSPSRSLPPWRRTWGRPRSAFTERSHHWPGIRTQQNPLKWKMRRAERQYPGCPRGGAKDGQGSRLTPTAVRGSHTAQARAPDWGTATRGAERRVRVRP